MADALRAIAIVTVLTGDPGDPASIAQGRSWLIAPDDVPAFAADMTARHGEPVHSIQPVGCLGTDNGLVVIDGREENPGA